jgi:RNA polymerase sigma-70 factor (ECF subfamily)
LCIARESNAVWRKNDKQDVCVSFWDKLLFFDRSEEAIQQFQSKYGGLCRRLALNLLHDETEAEDCLNDALLGVWNAIPPARPRVLSAFVCRVTRNLAPRRLAYLNADKRDRSRTLYLDEWDGLADHHGVEQVLDDKALDECINDFLGRLPPGERRVFVLRYWYNNGIREIAAICGYSQSKVKSMLYRTRKKLKHHLGKR